MNYKQMEEKFDLMTCHIGTLQASIMEGNRKLEALRTVVESQSKLADKLADKLVQMAMVNQGMGREAAGHRRAATEPSSVDEDLWKDEKHAEWPPPGHDSITMP